MYVLNNVNLNIVDSVKELGVIITCDRSRHKNIVKFVKKASKISYVVLHAFCSYCSIILYSRIWLAAITNCSWLIATAITYRPKIILCEYDYQRLLLT